MARVGRMVKEASVEEIAAEFSQRPNFFVTNCGRLPAVETDAFRQKLHASSARLVVIKRKLGQRAVERLKLSGLAELLEGSIGFVLSSGDILQIAKVIVEFRKTHEEQVALRGAVIDGQLLDRNRVEQLAQLPPKPVLLAQLVATIESPIADVIFTLERLLGDLAWIAEQVASKKPVEVVNAAPAEPAASAAPAAQAQEAAPAPQEHPQEKPEEPDTSSGPQESKP